MKRKGHYLHRGAPKAERPAHLPLRSDGARDRILAAARPLFAEHGFNATSVRDITTAAGVNLAAVSYYFTTKELLYVHVLQSICGPLAHRIEGIAKVRVPPLERIDRVVRAFLDHFRLNPDMPQFVMRELAAGREPSAPVIMMQKRVLAAVSRVITEGQAQGQIRAGNPALLTFSAVAQPVHLYLARHVIGAVSGLEIADPAVLDRIVAHVTLTVRRALEAR